MRDFQWSGIVYHNVNLFLRLLAAGQITEAIMGIQKQKFEVWGQGLGHLLTYHCNEHKLRAPALVSRCSDPNHLLNFQAMQSQALN